MPSLRKVVGHLLMLIRKYVNNNVSNDRSVRPNDVVVDILHHSLVSGASGIVQQ